MTIGLDEKLARFDAHAAQAVDEIVAWLTEHPDELIAIARERHVRGHDRFGDQGLFEYDRAELRSEAAEEIADAIVYTTRAIDLRTT